MLAWAHLHRCPGFNARGCAPRLPAPWACRRSRTRSGLSRFDGSCFITYGVADGVVVRRGCATAPLDRDLGRPEPPEDGWPHAVIALAEDRAGHLCAGSLLGVTRIDPSTGELRQHTARDGLARNEVTSASSGSYRFVVRAPDGDGWSAASPAFVIQRPVWQRGWFVSSMAGWLRSV